MKELKAIRNKMYEQLSTSKDVNHSLIEYQELSTYIIPVEVKKTFSRINYARIVDILVKIGACNNRHTGESISYACFQLDDNQEVRTLRSDLSCLIKQHLAKRMSKDNNKDSHYDDKVMRIIKEVGWITQMYTVPHSLNFYFFDISAILLQTLEEHRPHNTFCVSSIINAIASLFSADFELLANIANDDHVHTILEQDKDTLTKRNKQLTDNITEKCQALLIPNTHSLAIIHKGNAKLIWQWSLQEGNIGQLVVEQKSQYATFYLRHDGYIYDSHSHLSSLFSHYKKTENIQYLQLNVYLLQKVYNKLDIKYPDSLITEEENKIVLAYSEESNCIIEEEPLEETLKHGLKAYNITANSIWRVFLKKLEPLSVVIEPGKGDEVKIYRKNNQDKGKIYTTTKPKIDKREMLIKTQENVLSIIGISQQEWQSLS